jgi:hypothetical protein
MLLICGEQVDYYYPIIFMLILKQYIICNFVWIYENWNVEINAASLFNKTVVIFSNDKYEYVSSEATLLILFDNDNDNDVVFDRFSSTRTYHLPNAS